MSEATLLNAVIKGLSSLDGSNFYELNSDYRVRIPISQYQIVNADIAADPIVQMLQELRMYRSRAGAEYKSVIKEILSITYEHLSYGELKFINFFASIYAVLNHTYGDIYSSIESEKIEKEITFVLLLDEPDANFHPEWSRLFIYNLVRELNSGILSKYPCKYQIVITTHSPILLSDVPNNMISCISVEGSEEKKVRITDAPRGFMANISDIMKQSMFVDRPHGELATQFSLKLINDINSLRNQMENIPEQLNGHDIIAMLQQLSEEASLICDDVIRTRLENEILLIMQLYYANNISGSERRTNQFQRILKEFISLEDTNND